MLELLPPFRWNNIIWDSVFPSGQSSRMLKSQGLDAIRVARIRWEEAFVSQHFQDSFEACENLHDNSSERRHKLLGKHKWEKQFLEP